MAKTKNIFDGLIPFIMNMMSGNKEEGSEDEPFPLLLDPNFLSDYLTVELGHAGDYRDSNAILYVEDEDGNNLLHEGLNGHINLKFNDVHGKFIELDGDLKYVEEWDEQHTQKYCFLEGIFPNKPLIIHDEESGTESFIYCMYDGTIEDKVMTFTMTLRIGSTEKTFTLGGMTAAEYQDSYLQSGWYLPFEWINGEE